MVSRFNCLIWSFPLPENWAALSRRGSYFLGKSNQKWAPCEGLRLALRAIPVMESALKGRSDGPSLARIADATSMSLTPFSTNSTPGTS